MKLKYIFPLLATMLAFMVSCEKESDVTLLDEIRVSSSYVSIPVDGGSTDITLTTTDDWTLEKVTTEKNPVEWLEISTTSGKAGESKLTFKAAEVAGGRTAEVLIKSAGKTQRVNVIQGEIKVSPVKVAEALTSPDGKLLRMTGTVENISNTLYGNWDLVDETGRIYIYGTLDAKGQDKNFLSLGLDVGDEVTIEGPKGSYNGKAQMVNVSVIKINKSNIKVDSVENKVLPVEGGEFIAHLTNKGVGLSVDIPEEDKSWLSISSIQSAGTNVVVTFKATANEGGDRGSTINFSTTSGGKDYSAETSLTQKGAIIKASIKEFIDAEVSQIPYRLTGSIIKIDAKYDNNITIRDFSGEVLVYKLDKQGKEYKLGDIVTVVGKRGEYNGPQMVSPVLESVISVTPLTIAEVLTKPDSKEDFYMVTGEITEIVSDLIGRFYFKDASGETYVFGCSPGYGAVTNEEKNGLFEAKGIKVGDEITVIGNKSSYKEVGQLGGSFYFSHKSAE